MVEWTNSSRWGAGGEWVLEGVLQQPYLLWSHECYVEDDELEASADGGQDAGGADEGGGGAAASGGDPGAAVAAAAGPGEAEQRRGGEAEPLGPTGSTGREAGSCGGGEG